MQTKKLGLISAIVLAMVFIFALNASAGWYTCTVTSGGPAYAKTYIQLTDTGVPPDFTNQVFKFLNSRQKEMLAAALTAITNNMNVSVNLSGTGFLSTVYTMYLVP